jgi:hypothetical protein
VIYVIGISIYRSWQSACCLICADGRQSDAFAAPKMTIRLFKNGAKQSRSLRKTIESDTSRVQEQDQFHAGQNHILAN